MLFTVYGTCEGFKLLSFVDYFDNFEGAFDCFIRRNETKRNNETVWLYHKVYKEVA